MDKVVSSVGGQGPGGGGFLDIALPLGLGIAAAAHPALARGAHAITLSMATAGRNRRLKDVMAMQQKREQRAEHTAEMQDEIYQYNKSQRPIKERLATHRIMPTGGGEYRSVNVLNPEQGGSVVVPRYEGSPEQMQTFEQKQDLLNRGAIERAIALDPILRARYKYQADIQDQNIRGREYERMHMITPRDALTQANVLHDNMSQELKMIDTAASSGIDVLDPETIYNQKVAVLNKYRPAIKQYADMVPNIKMPQVPELPPYGFKPKPGYPGVFYNPKASPNDPNGLFVTEEAKRNYGLK